MGGGGYGVAQCAECAGSIVIVLLGGVMGRVLHELAAADPVERGDHPPRSYPSNHLARISHTHRAAPASGGC